MQAILLLTHIVNDYVLSNYRKLKSELNPNEYDVIMIVNKYESELSDFNIPEDVKYVYQNKYHMQEFIDKGHDYRFNFEKMGHLFATNVPKLSLLGKYYNQDIRHENEQYNQTQNCNLALMHFFLYNETKYSYYWYMENDVYFLGDSSIFFNDITINFPSYDFLAQNMVHFYECPWFPIFSVNNNYKTVDKYRLLKSFNPLCRFSYQALECIWDSMENEHNNSHFEIVWATSCYENDLKVGAFDGMFSYQLPGFFNKYTNIYSFNGCYVKNSFLKPTAPVKILHPVKTREKANEVSAIYA